MEASRLKVRKTETSGIDVDVFDADELIEESTRVFSENDDLESRLVGGVAVFQRGDHGRRVGSELIIGGCREGPTLPARR
ncbi:hypothetical protein [Natronorubrum texcoconense]|uniref:Uncharacterized protein n=1 Tax=Natronorubrum texcoconense TaxID=1095776 RepID=A0A1G9FV56_9EURY|nr:hypothetical protein [Natronorubrum texcoconense]SDK92248.1 hypothetical protein SAMN04515672_4299 [Natronorubrum texcoconense]